MDSYHLVEVGFLPSDYPYLVVTNPGRAAPGDFIGNIDGRAADDTQGRISFQRPFASEESDLLMELRAKGVRLSRAVSSWHRDLPARFREGKCQTWRIKDGTNTLFAPSTQTQR